MTCRPTTIRCTVTERVTLRVCAPQRVQPPALIGRAVCRGASTVVARGVCARVARAVVAGASRVTVRGSAVRAGRAVVAGASSVVSRAQIAHSMEHIKRIFGVDDILLLVAGDGAGGLTPYYTAPGFVETFHNVEGNVIPPVTDSFSQNGVEVGVSGVGFKGFLSPGIETFSMGMFVGKCTNDQGVVAQVSDIYLYVSGSLNRLMARDIDASINYYSSQNLAKFDEPDFWILEGDKDAQQIHLHGAGGKYTINTYPPMSRTDVRFGRITGNQIYDVQFYVLLNRLMTDDEIAQVRALL